MVCHFADAMWACASKTLEMTNRVNSTSESMYDIRVNQLSMGNHHYHHTQSYVSRCLSFWGLLWVTTVLNRRVDRMETHWHHTYVLALMWLRQWYSVRFRKGMCSLVRSYYLCTLLKWRALILIWCDVYGCVLFLVLRYWMFASVLESVPSDAAGLTIYLLTGVEKCAFFIGHL